MIASEIAARVLELREKIAAACRSAGRDPREVTLVAVSKTRPLDDLLAAYAAGVRDFGENRVQEAEAKFAAIPPDATRHLIGPIQSNKANRAARLGAIVHTIDSEELARRLSRAASAEGRDLAVYVEVNVGGERTKAGVTPDRTGPLVDVVRGLPRLELRGLMAIPPPGASRPHFARLRALAEAVGVRGLSMGMSDDFEEAIAEGATVVRIGTALFGGRPPAA